MENMKFVTKVDEESTFVNFSLYLLNKEKKLVKVELDDLDIGIKQGINLKWEMGVYAIRDNHCNLQCKVPSQIIEATLEMDTEYLDESLLSKGNGYEDFELKFEIGEDVELEYEHSNPFKDDFCPSEIQYDINSIKQVSESSFVATVSNVKVVF